MEHDEVKLAVLIDADNVSDKVFDNLFTEITKNGEATVRRIYGDFTSTSNARWKEILHKYAIRPISQFAYTKGKNATDSALIIDAMDLLHTGKFDGFCIVSSDSDYTGLAMRIKEEGLKVYGFGEEKTPEAFRNACHKFTSFELIEKSNTPVSQTKIKNGVVSLKDSSILSKDVPYDLIIKAIENTCDESGIARLSQIGTYLLRIKPDFDLRQYTKGNAPLATLLRAKPDLFEVIGKGGTMSVKIKS